MSVAWILVGACYKPSYDNCEVTCASGFCPAGLACNAGFCIRPGSAPCGSMPMIDGPMPDQPGPPGDRDGDTVLDADDNCPDVSNRDQFNEDADPFGDACDPCPPFPTAADNADADGDGVGDGCDPNPTSNADRLLFFEGFALDNTTPMGVIEQSSSWSFSNGIARVGMGTSGMSYGLLWSGMLPPGLNGETIMTRATIIQPIGGGNQPNLAGAAHVTGSVNGPGIVCELGLENNVGTMRLFDLASGGRLGVAQIPNFQIGQPFTLRSSRRGPTYNCEASVMPGLLLNGGGGSMSPNPMLGLYVHTATSQFDWIMVVASP